MDVGANQDAFAGGVVYIQKPFDPNELAAKVRDVLAFPCPRPTTDPQKARRSRRAPNDPALRGR